MKEKEIISVAIDGPAGVGKSTVAKLLAKKLGWATLETGALYRALTVEFLRRNVDFANERDVARNVAGTKIDVEYIKGVQHVFVNGKDLTKFLRQEIVEKNVSSVSKVPEVRKSIKKLQRDLATENLMVVEGRDIGTVVLPETVNKFFLTASAEVRTQRRYDELEAKGEHIDFDVLYEEIKQRDIVDSTRKVSPLKPAKDAIIIDTSYLTIDEVVDKIYKKIKGFSKVRYHEQVL